MSQNYDMQLEILTEKPAEQFDVVVRDWLRNIDTDHSTLLKHLIFFGDATLCGGMSSEEAHKEIDEQVRKIDPTAKVVTRWHYAEWDWDTEYGLEGWDEEEALSMVG